MNKLLHAFERKGEKSNSAGNWLWRQMLLLLIIISAFMPGETTAQTLPVIDGNPVDWNSANFNLFTIKKYQGDAFGNGVVDNQFTEGSKDFFPANQLVWSISQTKSKNDIANGAAIIKDGILYFAGDRTSNNGDAQIGFWLYLNGTGPVTVGGNNIFSPPHVDGDVLVLADFTGGGRNATVTIYQWDADGVAPAGQTIVPNTDNHLRTTSLVGTVAENNEGSFPIPIGWTFIQSTYDKNMFFEGQVDLTALGVLNLCNTSFLLETRSSQSITASLDDFVGGGFSVTPPPLVLTGSAICSTNPNTGTITSTTSQVGASYQLYNSANQTVGAAQPGTGSGLTWNNVPAGNGYYVIGAGALPACTSTSNLVNVTSIPPPTVTANDASLCIGKTLQLTASPAGGTWSGANVNASGVFNAAGLTAGTYNVTYNYTDPQTGCSNSDPATVTVNPTTSSSQELTICSNQLPYQWGGFTFEAAGTKVKDGLTNQYGCDSTATYILKVNPTTSSTQELTICSNQLPYQWGGFTFDAAGTKVKNNLTNQYGCDSTATYVLKVNPTTSSTQELTVCSNQLPYQWGGFTFDAAGTKVKNNLTNQYGCDSTATYVLKVNPTTSSTQELTICSNQLPYQWGGFTFDGAGTKVKDGLTNQYGCDSTATYILKVNPTTSSTQELTVCSNQLPYQWGGFTFDGAGTKVKDGLTNQYGCDSTATYILKVNPTTSSTQELTVCSNQLPYQWGGFTFEAAGTKVKNNLTNQYGCDSTATYILKVNPTTSSTQELTVCSNQLPYQWGGFTFDAAGTKVKNNLTNQYGCDSTATYILKVNPTTSSTQELTVCSNQLPYQWGGFTFDAAGTKVKNNLTNQYGCDSTATYILKVNPTTSSTQELTVCSNQLPYQWGGFTFDAAGTKVKNNLTNQYGCDSTATYILKVNPTTSSTQELTVCSNQLPYQWGGFTFDAAGTKVKNNLTNQYGCDSTATYILKVNPTTSSTQELTICSNQLPYQWGGFTFDAAGTKVKNNLTNQYGCDSTATYILKVNPTTSSTQELTICSNQLPYQWGGFTFDAAGTKVKDGLTNQYGCDSTATYVLTVNPLPIISCTVDPSTIDISSATHNTQLDVNLSANADTDPSHYTYSWTEDGAGSFNFSNIKNPVYTASVLDAGQTISFKVIVTNNLTGCVDSSECSIVVNTVGSCPEVPTSEVCNGSTNTYTAGRAPSTNETWKWSVNNGAAIVGADNGQSVTVTAGGQSFTLTLTVSYANTDLDPAECKYEVTVTPCGGYCTYTQGKYGNTSPACDGDGTGDGVAMTYPTVLDMIKAMLGVGGTPNPLVIGSNGNTVTIPATATAAALLNKSMPGGGSARELLSGNCVADNVPSLSSCWTPGTNTAATYITKQGKINNVLLSQTITLGLNMRVSSGLTNFVLQAGTFATAAGDGGCGSTTPKQRSCYYNELGQLVVVNEYTYKTISQSVIDALNSKGYALTVGGLYQLANDALGNADGEKGKEGGASLSDINQAVSSINEGFDECRIFIGWDVKPCTVPSTKVNLGGSGVVTTPGITAEAITKLTVSAYPNPFVDKVNFVIASPVSGKAALEVYSIFGQKLQTVFEGYLTAGRSQVVEFRPGAIAAGTLVYRFTINGKQVTGKVMSTK